MKSHKDEKIQVLLSSDDHHKLKNIILQYAIQSGKLVTVSSYVRELILSHIKEYEGEQSSFVNEEVKKIIAETNQKNLKTENKL
jgi:hypothetical protein